MQLSNLTPSATRTLLEQLGHQPRKKLGQNFLIDTNVVRKSMALGHVTHGDHIVEIGPGLGTLTAHLLDAGAIVYAVEIDPTLSTHLQHAFTHALEDGRLHLRTGDCIDFPLGDLPVNAHPCKIIANMPYAVATPWLEGVLAAPKLPESLVLMLQKEAADRYTAAPGSKQFSPIAIFLHASYERIAEHKVSAACFYPAPKVGSALLHLKRRPSPHCYHEHTRKLIRALFGQRRKQVATTLKQSDEAVTLSGWLQQFPEYGLTDTVRPEAIPHECWLALDKRIRAEMLRG